MRLLCALIRAANLRVRHVACAGPFRSLDVIWPHSEYVGGVLLTHSSLASDSPVSGSWKTLGTELIS